MASNLLEGKVFVKISELDPTVGFAAEDEFILVQNGVTLKTTGLDITDSVISIGNLANKPYVESAITALIDGAPGVLDTLNELATALNDDANFAGTITTIVNTKLASGDFGLRFWEELAQVNTYHIAEGINLYFTEQRVLDVLLPQVTTEILNVKDIVFTGTGAVNIGSGNDLNFVAAGAITFNGSEAITKTQLKSIVAASADFVDFKSRIAAL